MQKILVKFLEMVWKIKSRRKIIKGIRGKGLLNAIILDCDIKSKIPWNICLSIDNGLLAKPTQGNKIRFAPPIINKRQIKKALKIIDLSLVNSKLSLNIIDEVSQLSKVIVGQVIIL